MKILVDNGKDFLETALQKLFEVDSSITRSLRDKQGNELYRAG